MVRCFRKRVNFFGIMSRPVRGSLVRKHRKTETLQVKSGYLTERSRLIPAMLTLRTYPGS